MTGLCQKNKWVVVLGFFPPFTLIVCLWVFFLFLDFSFFFHCKPLVRESFPSLVRYYYLQRNLAACAMGNVLS